MKSMKSRRSGGASSGGIRKRGPTRTDRDGDMDMDGNGRGGKRARGNSGRSRGASGGRLAGGKARDKLGMNPDLIEKAISEDTQGHSQANVRQGKGSGGGTAQFAISGWRSSKVSSHRDGGVEHLLSFLERKMHNMTQKGPRVRISKSRVEGDILVASVRQDAADRMLRINGSNFAGVAITIEPYDSSVTVLDRQLSNGSQNASTADTKAKLTAVLSKRYFPQGHFLDLSNIMEDPDLKAMGLFENPSTESKFFPALMKLGGMQFNSSVQRQEAVQSVSLARCQLTNVSSFTSLAQTFPDIKNLDLSGNKIKDSRAMVAWRWKFRNLEGLDLSDNEYSSDPNFKETMMKWYPKLQILNKVQVRTPEEIAARKKTPIPVQPPYFQDESQICENFIRVFFPAYDNDRSGLLSRFYDNNSQFSMNINTQAPKAQHTETAGWDAYIRKSRNLEKISHLPARMSRLYVGVEKIREFWNVLPQTHHPDLFTHPEHYLIECHPIPGLPDPTGQSPTGVGGLIIMVHGKFEESINGKVETRSFDRTFTIGPGNGEGGIRVLNDSVCYRAYGGHEAWSPESQAIPQAMAPAAAIASIAAPFPEGYGAPAPGKPDAQVQQEQLVIQMSAKSGMTMEYSKMALEGNSWNLDLAWNNFETLKEPTLDALEAVDYDPVDHLNAIFSHPSTLSSVSEISDALHTYEDELDNDIGTLVEEQVTSNAESVERIQTAKADLSELFKKIDDVRERALKTEQAITDMTADIKQLDNAKKNLTLSMTALKRLQMLTTAYDQLQALSRTRQYRDCAQLLQAVIQLMAHFKSYRSIDQIAILSRNVADIQRGLLEQVCEDFEIAFAKGEVAQKRVTLSEACLVVDALGEYARSRLVTWYCNTQLREYRQVFRNNEEAGSLDNISRRYSWFRRILKIYDEENAAIFPASWRVNEILANVFCEGTRDDFKGILSRSVRSGQTIDVNLLLSCLQETLDFEHSLERRFTPARPSTDTFASTETPAFSQSISEAFEPYLSVWVEAQDKQLAALLPKYRQQPLKPPDEEFNSHTVISSSTELFTFYRHSLQQCAKLSTGNSLAELAKVFAKYLDQYAQQVLLLYISERPSGHTPSKVPSIEDLVSVLNTADYCYTTCSQLEEKIKSRLDEPLKESVDLQSQADSFMGIASAAVRGLVRQVEVHLEPCWREMRNTPWSKIEAVSDQSSYVGEMISQTKEKASEILQLLHKQQYARAFSDHLVELICSLFISNVLLCKPVSETGAEQMLLDSYTLKSGLSSLLPAPAPAGFVKRVNTSFFKIETLLKTVQVRPSPPEALVQAYLIHIADRNNNNFRKILDIKGIRSRQEQNHLVELFQLHRASDRYAAGLQQSNPILSALQTPSATSTGSVSQGLGLTGTSSMSMPSRFDASMLGSAIISAAKDGVDRFGNPSLGTLGSTGVSGGATSNTGMGGTSGSSSPAPPSSSQQTGHAHTPSESTAAGNLNENLKNIGKFFRRDLGGFGGRFGRGTDDP
ncbi:GARP complex subunit Vps53 [Penicillium argentinense]|uniref:mRNA export factor MEX67 n=1 Tax=Penicillium argentinense TaxID=1131581 RepID=A0A9W9JYX7_9EURO|nr:GARP complex subunit Vps53 [Penicillium argentinense]KAJ5086057.1 GARP complex subunit Vps53 [Penicillium argentinense]